MTKYFEFKKKIYLFDTDATDIVYYARHLEWMEAARIEFIADIYKPLTKMIHEDGISFMPLEVNIRYKAPAVFEDTVTVKLRVKEIIKLKMILEYETTKVVDGKEVIVSTAEIPMLCINTAKGGRPCRVPEMIIEAVKKWEAS